MHAAVGLPVRLLPVVKVQPVGTGPRLLAYSYDYGRPSIHASSHIQNFARIPAGQELALTGHFVAAYEQRGHHYAVFDGSVRSVADGREFARLRHTNIFQVAHRENA
ncbi:MAG: hypothetical protein ABI305_14060 [Tepidiformaceae bacterium]